MSQNLAEIILWTSVEVPTSQVGSDEFSSWCPPPVPAFFGESDAIKILVGGIPTPLQKYDFR